MTTHQPSLDAPGLTTGQDQRCPGCGTITGNVRFCSHCGHAIPFRTGARSEAPGAPVPAPPGPRTRVRLAGMVGAGALVVAVAGVLVLVFASTGGPSPGAVTASAYQQKLATALSPVAAANATLSTALQALDGSAATITTAAQDATSASAAAEAARATVGGLAVPHGDETLSVDVQQALTDAAGYAQAVSATLATPNASTAAQLGTLATQLQSALIPLGPLVSGSAASMSGTENLVSWANGAAAAAGRAHDAAQQQAMRRASAQAATAAAATRAPAASPSPTGLSSPTDGGTAGLPVQCGYGLAASQGITCDFAGNAFYEYWSSSGDNPTQFEPITVWSALANTSYVLSCSPGDGVVDCTGSNSSGTALDVRFPQSSVTAYTSTQASAYANSGKLGP